MPTESTPYQVGKRYSIPMIEVVTGYYTRNLLMPVQLPAHSDPELGV